ncbi:MAG: helix-turn-helix domain-containing protein [Terriglobia bacterium]
MASFGENLRRERELRGITLPELANATKISLRHLQALEANQFDRLPGGVFNRGFVRAVARYMNLDEHHWVGEFVRAAGEEPEILARYAAPSAGPPASRRRGMWSFALLLVVFGLGAYLVHEIRLRRAAEASPPLISRPDSTSQPPRVNVPPRLEPASEAATTAARSSLAMAEPSSPPTANPLETPEELRLQVDVPLDDAWVSVTVDGQPRYRGLMKAGETRSFRGVRRIELITGNASAVILTLNGETLPLLGDPRERKKLVLTAKDLNPATP